MTQVPVLSRNGWEMQVSRFPDRKKLALTVAPVNGAQTWVLGYFNGEDQADIFNAFLNGDMMEYLRDRA